MEEGEGRGGREGEERGGREGRGGGLPLSRSEKFLVEALFQMSNFMALITFLDVPDKVLQLSKNDIGVILPICGTFMAAHAPILQAIAAKF